MLTFVGLLSVAYAQIFHWDPWNAVYFVATTTFTNGNIGDLVPQVSVPITQPYPCLTVRTNFTLEEKTYVYSEKHQGKVTRTGLIPS